MTYRAAVLSTILMATSVTMIHAQTQTQESVDPLLAASSPLPASALPKCFVFAPQYRVGGGPYEECSIAACTEGYNPTAFSSEQAKICTDEDKKHPVPPNHWKTYEADNGLRFKVNMSTVRHSNLGVIVWGGIEGADIVAQPFIFNCGGYVILPAGGNGENGPVSTGWTLVPPRSVLGRVASDVCKNEASSDGRTCVTEISGQSIKKVCGTPGEAQYCIGYSPAACKRIRQAVNSKVRPYYCKKQWQYTGSGLTEEQVRICSVRVSEGIDPMPQ